MSFYAFGFVYQSSLTELESSSQEVAAHRGHHWASFLCPVFWYIQSPGRKQFRQDLEWRRFQEETTWRRMDSSKGPKKRYWSKPWSVTTGSSSHCSSRKWRKQCYKTWCELELWLREACQSCKNKGCSGFRGAVLKQGGQWQGEKPLPGSYHPLWPAGFPLTKSRGSQPTRSPDVTSDLTEAQSRAENRPGSEKENINNYLSVCLLI